MSRKYCIADEIFARFPGYCRGVVLASGLHNGPSPAALLKELRLAEQALAGRLSTETLIAHPHFAAWREAYRLSGVKPADFRPSVEALARRVLRRDPLPAISALVDLGNLVSLQHLLPVGAHSLDEVTQDLALRLAKGDELFEPFGADIVEHPLPGEIIFVEGSTVLTRRWTWRQAKHTLVVPETHSVEINVDGLPPVTPEQVRRICQQVADLVGQHCGGSPTWALLTRETPCMALD